MFYPNPKMFVLLVILCLLLGLGLAACNRERPAQSSPALQITLIAAPAGKDSGYQIVQVMDQTGQPVTDATVSLEGNMNHGGMAPMFGAAVNDDADGQADGRYQAPIQLNMLGDWIMTVTVKRSDGTTVNQDIPVQVRGQDIIIGQ